jgi:hypothetical protein
MKSPERILSRRKFLLSAGAGSVAAAAAVVVAGKTEVEPGKRAAATGSRGYHVTEHIRKYYDTAKV